MAVVFSSPELMPSRSRSGGRQEHPKGPLRTIDDELRQRVRDRLREKGWDQKKLAAELDVADATITNLLKPGQPRQIKYLDKLLTVLQLEDDLEVVTSNWHQLTADIRAAIVAIARARSSSK
jgi:transcriptional regulator with XRE-family HTH domain